MIAEETNSYQFKLLESLGSGVGCYAGKRGAPDVTNLSNVRRINPGGENM
jgi:hypothetical protein